MATKESNLAENKIIIELNEVYLQIRKLELENSKTLSQLSRLYSRVENLEVKKKGKMCFSNIDESKFKVMFETENKR